MKRKMKHVKFKGIVTPDIRPLNQREKKMNTRKGIRKSITKDHGPWKVLSLPLFGNPYIPASIDSIENENDDLEPDYIKKYKNIMK